LLTRSSMVKMARRLTPPERIDLSNAANDFQPLQPYHPQ
jgi:hypothetical protein